MKWWDTEVAWARAGVIPGKEKYYREGQTIAVFHNENEYENREDLKTSDNKPTIGVSRRNLGKPCH